MVGFTFGAFITNNVGLYLLSARTFHDVLQEIQSFATHVKFSLIQNTDTRIKFLITLPKELFEALKYEERSLINHFSQQPQNSFKSANEINLLYINAHVEFTSYIEKDQRANKLFYKIFDHVKSIVSMNGSRLPSVLYGMVVGGILLIHTLLIPLFLAIYGWIGGTIAILLLVVAMITIIDVVRSITSVFNIYAYNHDFTFRQVQFASTSIAKIFNPSRDEYEEV